MRIFESRLNWHPQVHRYLYEEDLYFYALRLTQPRDAAGAIDSLLREAGIRHRCAYVLHGYYDGFVRVWLTPQHRQRLIRVLSRTSPALLLQFREMKVTRLHYQWASEGGAVGPDLLAEDAITEALMTQVRDHEGTVRAVVTGTALDTPALRTLVDSDLLIEKPQEPNAKIKGVVVLEPTSILPDPQAVPEVIISGLEQQGVFDAFAMYSGDGDLGKYLIRFTLSGYSELAITSRKVDEVLGSLPLRSMTLLFSEAVGPESDGINNIAQLPRTHHDLTDELQVDLNRFEQLNFETRERLQAVVARYRQRLKEVGQWDPAAAACRAVITNDPLALRGSLSYILDFEFYFREYARIRLEEVYESNWEKKIVEDFSNRFRNVSDQDRKTYAQWPLGPLHAALIDMCRDNDFLRATLYNELGEDWAPVSRGVLDLRNPYAHGRLIRNIPDLSNLSGAWGDQFERAIQGMVMFGKLYNLVEGSDND